MGLPALVLAGVIASAVLSSPGATVRSNAGSLSSAHLQTACSLSQATDEARGKEGSSEAAREEEEEAEGEKAGEEGENAKGHEEAGDEDEEVCMCCSEPLMEAARGACGHRYYLCLFFETLKCASVVFQDL
ncbi:hypothetical protein T484DRAFT_1852104 [Baffinella frigidus]|nr:hypothetical protein T484DRAFT_1852104 [Cryptophyta sp. CCMP2293]